MAQRLNKRHQMMIREKIKASQLINRLSDHALKGADMSPSQVKAACYLVDQSIGKPTQPQEVTGADGGPVEYREAREKLYRQLAGDDET